MTDTIIDADGDATVVLSDGDRLLLLAGVTYSGQLAGQTVAGERIAVGIAGTLTQDDPALAAISLGADSPLSPGPAVVVGATGVIDADFGVLVEADAARIRNEGLITDRQGGAGAEPRLGVSVLGDMAVVVNEGVIDLRGGVDALPSIGISVIGNDAVIRNSGDVTAESVAIRLTGAESLILNTGLLRAGTGTQIDGDGNTVLNTGEISGARTEGAAGIEIDGARNLIANSGTVAGHSGVAIDGMQNAVLNTGVIRGTDHGIWSDPALVGDGDFGLDGLRLFNSGRIVTTDAGWAVDLVGSGMGFQNDGSLLGVDGGVRMVGDNNYLRNTGTIVVEAGSTGPAVMMDGQNTIFRNLGEVSGDVVFDDGNDVYRGRERNLGPDGQRTSGVVDGEIHLGGGDDLALGGRQTEIFHGGDGNDYMVGHQGDDIIIGGDGNDRLNGGDGDDVLTGGPGDDEFLYRINEDDDRITDFGDGADQFNFDAIGDITEEQVLAASTDTVDGVLIDLALLGSDGSILLEGLTKAELTWDFVI